MILIVTPPDWPSSKGMKKKKGWKWKAEGDQCIFSKAKALQKHYNDSEFFFFSSLQHYVFLEGVKGYHYSHEESFKKVWNNICSHFRYSHPKIYFSKGCSEIFAHKAAIYFKSLQDSTWNQTCFFFFYLKCTLDFWLRHTQT